MNGNQWIHKLKRISFIKIKLNSRNHKEIEMRKIKGNSWINVI